MGETKMNNHLSSGRLNVALLQDTLRNELLNLLQILKGPKVNKISIFQYSALF